MELAITSTEEQRVAALCARVGCDRVGCGHRDREEGLVPIVWTTQGAMRNYLPLGLDGVVVARLCRVFLPRRRGPFRTRSLRAALLTSRLPLSVTTGVTT